MTQKKREISPQDFVTPVLCGVTIVRLPMPSVVLLSPLRIVVIQMCAMPQFVSEVLVPRVESVLAYVVRPASHTHCTFCSLHYSQMACTITCLRAA